MWTRKDIKTRAKAVLKISYWKAFLVSLIIAVVGGNTGFHSFSWNIGGGDSTHNFSGSAAEMIGFLIVLAISAIILFLLYAAFRILLGYPLEVGGRRYFIQATQHKFDFNSLGFGFERPKYLNIVKSLLWRAFINFLWFLLLIIPGIVKAYAYRMVPYILADNPNIGYKRALELSNNMTRGQKFKMFVLDLSFIGWFILGMLALLIGVLFVIPYVNATYAELYVVLRQNAIESGLCTDEELSITV